MAFTMQFCKSLAKMKRVLLAFVVLISTLNYAQAPDGYYSNAEGLTGYLLKTALKNIIDDLDDGDGFPYHEDQGYGALYHAYAQENSGDTDAYYENDGSILDMYSEKINKEESYNYEHFQNRCGNFDEEGDCYNREHLVPQSIFNRASPMKNDYFHVVPSDGSVNSARGNLPFGEVSYPNYVSSNGSKRGSNKFPGYSGVVFEPIDEFKGDIARSVLYFAIRYEDEFSYSWSKSNVLADNAQDFFADWYIQLLLSWHAKDPVSQREKDRNNNGFQFQGNRNPLIDHPEFAFQIWSDFYDDTPPTAPMNLNASTITDSSIELVWEASQDNFSVNSYIIEQDNKEIVELSAEKLSYIVTDLTAETLYNFRIYAIDQSGNISEASENLEVVTRPESFYLISEDFEDCHKVQHNFRSVSELSPINWKCQSNAGVANSQSYRMNAYKEGKQVPSLDWLITTKPIDFDNYEIVKLSFWCSSSFGNTKLELLYSSTYDGNGNPSDFDWETIPNVDIPIHPKESKTTFTFKANAVDISEIADEVYIAFRYNTTNGDLATRWDVDNIKISGEQPLYEDTFEKKPKVEFYFNPSSTGKIKLNFDKNGRKLIELFNMKGEKILSHHTYMKNYEENLSEFAKGNYFLKIKQNGNSILKRIIIN